VPDSAFEPTGTRLRSGHARDTEKPERRAGQLGAAGVQISRRITLTEVMEPLRSAPSVRQLIRKKIFRTGWAVGVRITLFVSVAIGAIGLSAAPVALSEPPTYLSGCGHGSYRNSDGDCIPDPSPVGGLPADGTPGLVTAPGFVGTTPGVESAPGFSGGGTPGGPPPGVTARCRDGDYSHSTHHSGTCSGHGGVAEWYTN
jgi:Protein of unknown function (DUF3761)